MGELWGVFCGDLEKIDSVIMALHCIIPTLHIPIPWWVSHWAMAGVIKNTGQTVQVSIYTGKHILAINKLHSQSVEIMAKWGSFKAHVAYVHMPWSLMFPLISTWTNSWVSHQDAGNLRCHWAHYDVTVIELKSGPWFNIKMTSYQCRKSHCGDKRSYDRLISTIWFPILVRWHLYIDSEPCFPNCVVVPIHIPNQGAVSIRKKVLPGMAIPILKIRRPLNNKTVFILRQALNAYNPVIIPTATHPRHHLVHKVILKI